MGVPTYGFGKDKDRREELAQPAPTAEVIGVVKPEFTDPAPRQESAAWSGSLGDVSMTEPPPPWEVGSEFDASDARRYVEVPSNWTLRWINPRLLDSQGWQYWQPVTASDSRVKCKVDSMVGPDGNVHRGGQTGDILAWMLTSWVESRRRQHQKKTDERTASAVSKQDNLREEFRRGTFGKIRLEEARHPTHTMFEGKSVKGND